MKNRILVLLSFLILTGCGSEGENPVRDNSLRESRSNKAASENKDTEVKLQEGDIIFQDLDCGDFCDAIETVTESVGDRRFSHCALAVNDSSGRLFILEAVGKGVVLTAPEDFFSKKVNDSSVVIGRLKREHRGMIPGAVSRAKTLLGASYDEVFDLKNKSYYCSEVMYEAFRNKQGEAVFRPEPMTFKDPATGEFFEAWKTYYDKLGKEIPEGEPGLNPGGISRSGLLTIHVFELRDFRR